MKILNLNDYATPENAKFLAEILRKATKNDPVFLMDGKNVLAMGVNCDSKLVKKYQCYDIDLQDLIDRITLHWDKLLQGFKYSLSFESASSVEHGLSKTAVYLTITGNPLIPAITKIIKSQVGKHSITKNNIQFGLHEKFDQSEANAVEIELTKDQIMLEYGRVDW